MTMIKNRKLAFLALGLSAAVFSCTPEKVDPTVQDESTETEETVEVKAPEINFELSGLAEKLHNEITLTVSGKTDDDIIEKVEFFLNDQSLGEDIEAPYEFVWNTKDVEDGSYELKVMAYNNGGEGEAIESVNVKNTLLVVNIPNQYNKGNRDGEERDAWAFLSDKNGETLGEAQHLLDGTKLVFYRPKGFDSDSIYLNVLNYNTYYDTWRDKDHTTLNLLTYPTITLAELKLKPSTANSGQSIGEVDITVRNDFDGTKSYDYGTHLFNRINSRPSSGTIVSYSMAMNEETAEGISFYETTLDRDVNLMEREKYFRLDDFQVGNHYDFHTDEYKAMNSTPVSVSFNYNDIIMFSAGAKSEGDRSHQLDFIFLNEGNEFKFFSTDELPVQSTYINASINTKSMFMILNGGAPGTISMPDYSVSIANDNQNSFDVQSVQGSFDVGQAIWRKVIDSELENYYIRRGIYFDNQADVNIYKPKIPNELLELYPKLNEELEYNSTYVLDNANLESYEDIIKYWFTDEFTGRRYAPSTSLTLYPEREGGRMAGANDERDPKEILEEEKLRTKGLF